MEEKSAKPSRRSEFLLDYGWAIIILATIAITIYFVVFAPGNKLVSICNFATGTYCNRVVFGSNSNMSSVAMLITNTQPFAIAKPQVQINYSKTPPTNGLCGPNFVQVGGEMVCNVTFLKNPESLGAVLRGKVYLSAIPCLTANLSKCQNDPTLTFSGSFNVSVSPLITQVPANLSLTVQNTTQLANGYADVIAASVSLLGNPLPEASVLFTQSNSFAILASSIVTADVNGTAASAISSQAPGTTIVTAAFANVSANTTVRFVTPTFVTIQALQATNTSICSLQNAAVPVMIVDSKTYTCSQLPLRFGYQANLQHSFTFISTVPGPAGSRYFFQSASGCGISGQSGTLTAGASNTTCTINATYTTQYFLSELSNPDNGGKTSPGSEWLSPGSVVTINQTPNAGWFFKNWVGVGIGSYSGTSPSVSLTLNNSVTEQASYYSTSTSTTSTSTTSTRTTTLGVTTTIKYFYSSTTGFGSASASFIPGGTLFLCEGGGESPLASYSWIADKSDIGSYASVGHQTSVSCSGAESTKNPLAVGGVALVSPSNYTLYSSSCNTSSCLLQQAYSVRSLRAFVVILASCGFNICKWGSLPTGCTQLFSTRIGTTPGAGSFAAVCTSQPSGTYQASATVSPNGGAATIAVYVFPS